MIVFFATLALIGLTLAAPMPWLGQYHWAADLLSHFVVQYACVTAVILVIFLYAHHTKSALLSMALLAFFSWQVWPLLNIREMIATSDKNERVTILQYNMWKDNLTPDLAIDWLKTQTDDTDVMVLLEVQKDWEKPLAEVAKAYPYSFTYPINGHQGIAVFSRLPSSQFAIKYWEGTDSTYIGLVTMTPKRRHTLTLYALHPINPLSGEKFHSRNLVLLQAAKAALQNEADYKILAGDFNVSPWSWWFRDVVRLSGLKDSALQKGLLPTWPAQLPSPLRIPIDHLLIPPNGTVISKTLGPANGSDHLPVKTVLELY